MTVFNYKAASAAGELVAGSLEANDQAAVVAQLQARGLIPIAVNVGAGGTAIGSAPSMFGDRRIGADQIGDLTRELATLLRSGLPLDRALEILIGMASSPALRALLERIRDDVRGGSALSRALEAHPREFSRFYLGMVRAGEAGGALGPALQRISEFMERSKDLRETVVSALVYPSILVLASVTSVLLLLIFVVPQFSQMFEQSGKALPLPTQIVISCGEWVRHYWWSLPLGAAALWRYAHWQMANPVRKRVWDARILRLLLVGDLVIKVEVARFARTLSTLIGNGQSLLPALGIVRETIGNTLVAESVTAAREQLQAGQGLSKPLMSHGVFPPLAVHMMAVGEETGRLGEMLERTADIYDREVAIAVKRMLTLLEPALILGLGLVIGGIILSILLAILKVNSLVG